MKLGKSLSQELHGIVWYDVKRPTTLSLDKPFLKTTVFETIFEPSWDLIVIPMWFEINNSVLNSVNGPTNNSRWVSVKILHESFVFFSY